MRYMSRKISFILSALLFLAVVPKGFGQSYRVFHSELNMIKESAKWHLGPLRFYPLFRMRDIGYDDNVYRQRELDDPVSDYTATLSPEINAYLLFRDSMILSFMERPEYVFFSKQKRERRWNNTLSPQIKMLLFHRFVLSAGYNYSNRRHRASSEIDVRANVKTKAYTGRILYESARRTSFGFSGRIEEDRYEDITLPGEEIYLSRRLNRDEQTGNIEFYYRIFSQSFFTLRASYSDYAFKSEEFRWRDSYSYQFLSGVQFPLLGRIRGNFSLGYKRLEPRDQERDGFSGLIADTRMDMRLGRVNLRLRYNRDCFFSYWTNNVFYNDNIYGGGASIYLTQFLRLDYDLTYWRSRYPEPIPEIQPDGSVLDILRRDRAFNHSTGLVFRIVQDFGIGFKANFWKRNSNYSVVNRKNWFFGADLTYDF